MTTAVGECPECGTQMASGLLSCPSCARLVYADRLRELATAASAAEASQDWTGALTAWRQSLTLLPGDTRQRTVIESKVVDLSRRAGESEAPWWKRKSWLGPLGVGAAFLGKAKFLLLGFTKLGTLLSFLGTFSLYWALWGWQFALCFLLCIYVHEMGHVAELRHFGIRATAPMFIPGFGALVRLKERLVSPIEDARVGLAGPIWGTGACLAAAVLYAGTGAPFWGGVARAAAWLNLFNLVPVWQLDGRRGTSSLTQVQIATLAALSGGMWFLAHSGLLLVIAALLAFRAYSHHEDTEPDWTAFGQFAGLLVVLPLFELIPLPH